MKKATIIKGKKPKANDSYPGFEDELTLAELIQNAAARGLTSVRGSLFARPKTKDDLETFKSGKHCLVSVPAATIENEIVSEGGALFEAPPEGTTCACALGAMALTPKLTRPLSYSALSGNDASDKTQLDAVHSWDADGVTPVYVYDDIRSMQIGVAYEQALRPN